MADIDVTPGSGKTVATDTVAGKEHQLVKQGFGNSTSFTRASSNTGALDDGTQRFTLATNDPAVASLASLVAGIVGNVAHDAADSGNPLKVGGKATSSAPAAVTAGDRSNFWTDLFGSLRTVAVGSDGVVIDQTATVNVAQDSTAMKLGATSVTPKFAAISSTGSGDTLALVSGKKIRVLSMFFLVAAATTVKFQTGATTDLTGAMSYAANDGISLPFNPLGWFETASGAKLNHVLGTSVGIAGGFTYIEV